MTALFRLEGGTAHPSEHTRGPWRADAQHGGPPSALLTRLIESVTEPGQWIARISVELLSPVPLSPLRWDAHSDRVSRRVGIATAKLFDHDRLVARATARLLTTTSAPAPDVAIERSRGLPGPETEQRAPAWIVGATEVTYHRDALRHRWESGGFSQPGPAQCWQALAVAVIDGEPTTGHQRIMAIADIASGVSAVYSDTARFGMINADLDVVFVREPRGEWLRSDAVTRVGDDGTGVCTNLMCDEAGVVAAGSQTLLGRPF